MIARDMPPDMIARDMPPDNNASRDETSPFLHLTPSLMTSQRFRVGEGLDVETPELCGRKV